MAIYSDIIGGGPDIVFLHGLCDDSRFFAPIIKQLENDYRLTLFDQPGNGKSAWQNDPKNIYNLVEQFLPVLPEKAIYIGWSMGGPLAMALAARYPERVERIITIASTPKFIEDDHWVGMPSAGLANLIIPPAREIGMPAFLQQFMEGEFAQFSQKPEEFAQVNQIITDSVAVDMDAIEKRAKILDASDQRNDLSQLHCPIDFILGSDDASVPAADFAQIKALNKNCTLHIIEHAQHAPFLTHPKEFSDTLKSILTKQE